jgi:serralysin
MATPDIIKLTDATQNQASFQLLETDPLALNQGLSITFDFYSYGGNGGDGFSFIILDGAVSPVSAGGFGGSLGYAQRIDGANTQSGILGGVLGVGFDEFGNYSNQLEGRVGGNGRIPDSIAIRGSSGAAGNPYLAGTSTLASGIDVPGATNRDQAKRTAKVDLVAQGNDVFVSVKVDFNNDGVFDVQNADEVNPALQNIRVGDLATLPSNYRFGFAAATGESTNIHEVDNFRATTANGTPIRIGKAQVIIGDNQGNGTDNLSGKGGNDTIVGGLGGDNQSGNGGADRFVFSGATKALALQSSLLRSPDRITDFKFSEGDKFQLDFDSNLATTSLPPRLFNAGTIKGGNLKRAIKSIYKDRNLAKKGNQALKKDEALFFTFGSKTYLSVNDDKLGFQPRRDLLADVTNIGFKAGDNQRGRLSVTDYFA